MRDFLTGINPSLFGIQPLFYCQRLRFWPPAERWGLFFFLPLHFVDVFITHLSAPKNPKVNNGMHGCQYRVLLICSFVPFAKYTNPAQTKQYPRANAANGIMQWCNSWLIWKGSVKPQTEEMNPDCLHGGYYRRCCFDCCDTLVCSKTFCHGKLSDFTKFVWKKTLLKRFSFHLHIIILCSEL